MRHLTERAVSTRRDKLAYVESWATPRDDAGERQRRAWRMAAIWLVAIMAELLVVGVIYRAVMSTVASM